MIGCAAINIHIAVKGYDTDENRRSDTANDHGFPPCWQGIKRCLIADDFCDRHSLNSSQFVDEHEIGGGPQRGGNGVLRAGGDYDFEDFTVTGQIVEKIATLR
jgi:hypothetical protein